MSSRSSATTSSALATASTGSDGGAGDRAAAGVAGAVDRARRPGVGERQVQRERAALPGRADQPDLAAEQRRQLAADREAEAGAAVLAAGAGVGLLERLEDQLLLLRRDADAGVGDLERDGALARTAAPDGRATSPR